MSLKDFSRNKDELLIDHSGVMGDVLKKAFRPSVKMPWPLFFKPYDSWTDPFIRAATIVLAPACLLLLTVKYALTCVFFTFKALVDLARRDLVAADQSCRGILFGVFFTITCLVSAVASLFVNAVDLIGSGVKMATAKNPEKEKAEALSPQEAPATADPERTCCM